MQTKPKFKWERHESPDTGTIEHRLLERKRKKGKQFLAWTTSIFTNKFRPSECYATLDFNHWLLGHLNTTAEVKQGKLVNPRETSNWPHAPGLHSRLPVLPRFVSWPIIKNAAERKLKEALEYAPNEEVARVVGLTHLITSEISEDPEEYTAGEIDDSPWKADESIPRVHSYSQEFVRLNTMHTGSHLEVNGHLLYDEEWHPVDFRIHANGTITSTTQYVSDLLFPAKSNSRAKYFRRVLKTALTAHPREYEFRKGITKL